MCRISCDVDYVAPTTNPAVHAAPHPFPVFLLAAGLGAAVGLAEVFAPVTWPPAVGLVAGCLCLAAAAPKSSWGLGLVAGFAAAVPDLWLGHGRSTPLHYGAVGAFGALLPSLAAAYMGALTSQVASRIKSRRAAA